MSHELQLGCYMKRASLVTDDLDELAPDGIRVLQFMSAGYDEHTAFM